MSKSNLTTSSHFESETSLPPSRVKAIDISPLAELTLQTLWTKGKIRMRCVKITIETHDVKTFHLISEPAQLFFFKPGQFISLELNVEGKKVLRSYTISSSPSRPYTLAITVKRVEGGLVSNWLHDNLKPGDEIVINGPFGKFNCFDVPSPKMLFISAGSGITPMMSMVRWLCDTHSNCNMTFIYSARTPSDIIFRRELELLEVQRENFTVAITCTRTESNGKVWTGFKGRLNHLMLQFMAPDYLERVIYVCGPASFMENVRKILVNLNFSMENYNEESFGDNNSKKSKPSTKRTPSTSQPVLDHELATLVFKRSGKEIQCSTKDVILDIAEAEGIEIANACRAGCCGTCKTKKFEGHVQMESTEGLTEEEIKEGYFLACCSRAQGKVILNA